MSDKITLIKNPHSTLPGALTVVEDAKLPTHVFVLQTEDHEIRVDAKNGKVRKRKRLKFEPPPNYGTLMTWEDFLDGVACGGFIDGDDGSGEFATATEVSNIPVPLDSIYSKVHHSGEDADIAVQKIKSPYPWATHVHWCGK